MTTLFDQNLSFLKDQREQWENALKNELKITDINRKVDKKNIDLGVWPVLSLTAIPSSAPSKSDWKKASQTYLTYPHALKEWLMEDLDQGVRCFFFGGPNLDFKILEVIQSVFRTSPYYEEIEFYFLDQIIAGHEVHKNGGNSIQELAMAIIKLIENDDSIQNLTLGVYLDSKFFANIAKLRALRLLSTKIITEKNSQQTIRIIGLNSYRDWTLYDRYSNILRNNIQVASALIGAADSIQSSGYEALFELLDNTDSEHMSRSRRIARNTTHILGLESMLGIVEDASFGSFHIESMAQEMAQRSWDLMQILLPLDKTEREMKINQEVEIIKQQRKLNFNTRKTVLTGINDFALIGEEIHFNNKISFPFYRLAQDWESLRQKVEKMKNPPEVIIKLKGDYGHLSNRVNFVKNYFETIGLKVHDPLGPNLPITQMHVLVLCAADDDYLNWINEYESVESCNKFVAGNLELSGFVPIFVGQNVYETLFKMVEGWKI